MTGGSAAYGEPEPLGTTPRGDGVNVAVFSAHAHAIEFCLFEGEREVRRVRLRGRTGDVFHDQISDVAPGARYGLRAHGPFLPNEGHYFNAAKLLVDPYARLIDRPFALHASMFGSHSAAGNVAPSIDDTDSAPFMPKGIVLGTAAVAGPTRRITPWSQTVLYELHVRGFTAGHPAIAATSRGRFSGLGHPASIEHLVRLGVTTVEIMPAAAWIEERHLASLGLRNYWGYNPVTFMAPDPGLAPGGWDEIRAAVVALSAAGIEVVLDIVLNHTGEGDALGPTLSLRGLDNATYYRALPGAPWRYTDDAGCGNTIALDRPTPLRLAMDALRTWAVEARVHGFRFDLATCLGRRDDGFDPAAPLLSAIAQEPLLRDLKLIAEPWDVGSGGYRIGAFPANWGEWNDQFRDGMRRFWRGDSGQTGDLATRMAGSSDLFASRRVASRSINFIVAHDGFTLADLVSYTHKVNIANGEQNRDGTDANHSWNNGVEGPSDDPAVGAARRRDQRALLATLILARGTPMLEMGSEFGHSQGGNNNAYAQDNPTAWLDWASADVGMLAWTRRLLRIRRDYQVLRGDNFLTGTPFDASLLPDVEWRDAESSLVTPEAWRAADGNTLVMTLAGIAEGGNATSRVSVILHRGPRDESVMLPPSRAGYRWHLIANSAVEPDGHEDMISPVRDPYSRVSERPTDVPRPAADWNGTETGTPVNEAEAGLAITEPTMIVGGRSVLVLVERRRDPGGRTVAESGLLDRLARAAGIAPDWWTVDGRHTVVSVETKRALLASMRLPAATEAEARDSLRHLSDIQDRRALPLTLVSRVGEPIALNIAVESTIGRRPLWLTVVREDGEAVRIRLGSEDGILTAITGVDGLPGLAWRVKLPSLPEGRHRIWREDAPDAVCHLTVAPGGCFLAGSIRAGGKRFGISAQLYALRRVDDQGVGDFTTLAMLAETAAREGASAVGINPLHMLFPGERERASPYHPSDRRFVDPIYLDVADGIGDPDPQVARGFTRDQLARAGPAPARDVVAWSEVWAFKQAILERRFAAFTAGETANAAAAEAFRGFINTGGLDLWRFAAFQTIAEARPGETWQQWPDGLRSPDSAEVKAFAHAHAERLRFHQYLQFLADRQFAAAAAKATASGLEPGLFRDLAVGAAPDGAESWARSEDLAVGAWIGAPPDPFAAHGQNWHLPPPLPRGLPRNGFASFAALVAANMRHAGVLRIDHAMGLSRLFWIPDGGTGRDGAYVAYPFADLLGQVTLESSRAGCMVVGEDLGTVPDGFREATTKADVLGYRVLLLEQEGAAFKPAISYPARAVACVTTHDLPPLAGWWEGTDLRERADLGLLRDRGAAEKERKVERTALVDALDREGFLARPEVGDPPIGAVTRGAYEFVAASSCDLVLVQAEDLAGMRVGVNLPGTNTERPNWRLRLPVSAEALLCGDTAQGILGLMRSMGRGTGAGREIDTHEDDDPTTRGP